MSGDEIIVLIASGAFALIVWGAWYFRAMRVTPAAHSSLGRTVLLAAPPLAIAAVYGVLRAAAAGDVREDPRYLLMYSALGAAWLGLATVWLPAAGISPRDDAIERGNPAAGIAAGAALLAVALCYAGGNVGDGPGWWVVVFSAALATGALFLSWLLFETVSGISDVVTIDRDLSAGVRLGAFLVACGAIFGRAAAGDWVSAPATVADFVVVAQPAVLILAAAAFVERAARPTPSRPVPSIAVYGVAPALLYMGVAAAHLLRLGPPA
jgi:hypothetical protein